MGVTKTLMASNDTLFNFEDTLGEREDVFSPRTPSRGETQVNTPVKNSKSTENSIGTTTATGSGTDKSDNLTNSSPEHLANQLPEKRSPPKSINILDAFEMQPDNDLCSPEQQKTFSDGTTSSTTDRISSDMSGTVDHDTTFTTNTIDDKTCITVIIKDDERISEISEPEWGSTASFGGYEMNSLTDVPSLDFNVNDFEEKLKVDDMETAQNVEQLRIGNDTTIVLSNTKETKDIYDDNENGHDDSGHSTQVSTDEKSTSDNMSEPETHVIEEAVEEKKEENKNEINKTLAESELSPSNTNTNNDKQHCLNFLKNEIDNSSTHNFGDNTDSGGSIADFKTNKRQNHDETFPIETDADSLKENTDPNSKILINRLNEFEKNSNQKVQNNSQDTVIIDAKNISSDFFEKGLTNGINDNIFYKPEIALIPNKHQQSIINFSVNGITGPQNCIMVADEMIGHLSGEEDPWVAEPISDIRFTGPCSEMLSTSFTVNEWDSDVDDSHSSEEFMYVRGTPASEGTSSDNILSQYESAKTDNSFPTLEENNYESQIWSPHDDDQILISTKNEEEISEGSSSEFEGEFVPSCWDSMAIPARSALKSPDKSSSEEEPRSSDNKKRRSVAFKKQRYHSVYEYPRENSSLSPAYSEPFLWNRDPVNSIFYDEKDGTEEFDDGFTVSSSMRPFQGSQFSALCHTWPPDSDFSWSQVEDFNPINDEKKLPTYSNIDIKWPQSLNVSDLDDLQVQNCNIEESKRPDSGVGESAEMLNERLTLGELCHTKSTLRLPIALLPPVETILEQKVERKESESFAETLTLPTPSCTGSMDSLSSSSGSDRQISFSTFGKRNSCTETNEKKNLEAIDIQRPALILIESGPIEIKLKTDKIRQSDSTDEDSGIESIMKINNKSD